MVSAVGFVEIPTSRQRCLALFRVQHSSSGADKFLPTACTITKAGAGREHTYDTHTAAAPTEAGKQVCYISTALVLLALCDSIAPCIVRSTYLPLSRRKQHKQ